MKKFVNASIKEIAEKAKKKRLELNLSMKEVADSAGVAVGTVWRIEQGNLGCNSNSIEKVKFALDLQD